MDQNFFRLKIFWTQVFIGPKIFLGTKSFFNPLFNQNLLDRNSLGCYLFRTQNIFGPIFCTQNFVGPNFFQPITFFQPKMFWTQNFFAPKFIWTLILWTENLFGLKIFVDPKIFLEPKLFYDPKFCWAPIFWAQNF